MYIDAFSVPDCWRAKVNYKDYTKGSTLCKCDNPCPAQSPLSAK